VDQFGGPELVVLYGGPDHGGAWMSIAGDTLTLHADVLGSSFFAMTRLEEVGAGQRDAYGRFPQEATVAWREGFVTRAVVDEYTNLLWWAMLRQWPRMRRRVRDFAVRVSHDVDRPMAYDHKALRDRLWSVRHHAGEGTLPQLAGSHGLNALAAALRLPHRDPFDTFDLLMDADERRGLRATYFFLCGGTSRHDGRYDIRSKRMRRLLRRISERGHEIGLHGSYETIDAPVLLQDQKRRLAAVLEEEGLPSEVRSCRQHYLRWQAPTTWRVQQAAGLAIDASVGFNGAAGFRCGTSFEHPVFDAEERAPLRLRERPLHIMDRVLAGLDEEQAQAAIDEVRQEVARHGGTLEILWHNNTFVESHGEWQRYERAMMGAP
jgi:peptidoglycan/xylan/chitin deacetylase (PgdA/CDA1 family)